MGARGRKSAADLSVVPMGERARRPAPPDDLTDDQREVWLDVVQAMPSDWFGRETHATLAQLCRHVDRARKFAAVLDHADVAKMLKDGHIDELSKLSAMAERESRAALAHARSLRLTQQARMRPETAKRQTQRAGNSPYEWMGE